MTAAPTFLVTTLPVLLTVATVVSELDQVTVALMIGVPVRSTGVAESCRESPITTLGVEGDTSTALTVADTLVDESLHADAASARVERRMRPYRLRNSMIHSC